MLNQVVIVGRIHDYNLDEKTLTLAIPRSYKNENGEYDSDIIKFKLWNNMASQIAYLKIGDIVGIRGRLEKENGELQVKTDKLTFLSNTQRGDGFEN